MNLRDIKKDIEYFIGEFIDDCSLFIALNPNKDTEKVSGIIDERKRHISTISAGKCLRSSTN